MSKEIKQLQKLAGLLKESQVNEAAYSPAADLEQRISHLLSVVSTSSKIPTDIKSELIGEFNQIASIITSMLEAEEADSFYDDDDYGPVSDYSKRRASEMNEQSNPEGDKLVLRFLQGVAKKFEYPVSQAAIFVKDTIKKLGY